MSETIPRAVLHLLTGYNWSVRLILKSIACFVTIVAMACQTNLGKFNLVKTHTGPSTWSLHDGLISCMDPFLH